MQGFRACARGGWDLACGIWDSPKQSGGLWLRVLEAYEFVGFQSLGPSALEPSDPLIHWRYLR